MAKNIETGLVLESIDFEEKDDDSEPRLLAEREGFEPSIGVNPILP